MPAELELFVGETRVLPSPNVARIAVGNGRLLSASVIDERDILLIANDAGATTMHVWARDGRARRYNLQVRPADMSRTTREILEFLSGSSNVKARAVGDRVLVEGQNLTDEQLFRIDELAKRYPQIVNFTTRVGWERMILMDVKVVEFKKDKLRVSLAYVGTRARRDSTQVSGATSFAAGLSSIHRSARPEFKALRHCHARLIRFAGTSASCLRFRRA